MAVAPTSPASGLTTKSDALPTSIWLVAGVFGLLGAGLLMLFNDPLSGRLVWLVENYRTGVSPLCEGNIRAVEDGLKIWAWSGIIVGAVSLSLAHQDIRTGVARSFSWATDRVFRPLPLAADRYGLAFLGSTGAVLGFTVLTHWSLTAYQDVDWFGGEDGAS